MSEANVIAVLIAGGGGRRMWPFATVRPKATLPVGNRPLISLMAERLAAAGFRQVLAVVDEHGGPIRAALVDTRVEVLTERSTGSAEALLAAWLRYPDATAVVVPADALVSMADLEAMREAAQAAEAEATVLIAPMGPEDPNRWIGVEAAGESLTEVVGHPREASWRWSGVCALAPGFRRFVEANPGLLENVPVGGMPAPEADLSSSVALALEKGVPVRALRSQRGFVDLDKPWHILEANRLYAGECFEGVEGVSVAGGATVSDAAEVEGRLIVAEGATVGPRVRIRGDVYVGPGAVVDNGAILQGTVLVGAGARVSDYCQVSQAVVGAKCVVGHGAEFTGVLFTGTYLYHYCEIYGVLGAAVDIGAASVCGTLRFDDGDRTHRVAGAWERPATGANASYLGDYTRTGVNAILMPGVKVGAYSCIGPGVVLYDDVPDRSLVLVKQELERRSWGPEKYGW